MKTSKQIDLEMFGCPAKEIEAALQLHRRKFTENGAGTKEVADAAFVRSILADAQEAIRKGTPEKAVQLIHRARLVLMGL